MRLTLRTLLAYLDDVLEPSQAKELGERIAGNKEAKALESRIREVIRRRRIGAPELSGAGSGPDPNFVSDYLENTLPPNEVVELERLCMESDMHLAEVAACHQILTSVLGQPVDVPDVVSERMYALGSATRPQEAMPAAPEEPSEPIPFGEGLPDYLVKKPFLQRFSTIAMMLAIAGVWFALVVYDPGMRKVDESQELAVVDNINVVPDPPVEVATSEPVTAVPVVSPTPRHLPSPPAPPVDNAPISINPPPPEDGGVAILDNPPVEMKLPTGDPLPTTDTEPLPEPPVDTLVQSNQHRPMAAEAPLQLVDVQGVLIYRAQGEKTWQVYSPAANFDVGDELAAPAPFRAQLRIGECLLTLEPFTRVQRLGRSEDQEYRLKLDRGRILLQRAGDQPVNIGLQIQQRDWAVSLLDAETRCGIEYTPPVPTGPPGDSGPLAGSAAIGVTSGTVAIQLGADQIQEIRPDNAWTIWPVQGDKFETATANIPAWATPEGALETPSARILARNYEKEFSLHKPINQSISPVVESRVAANSQFATQTLALMDYYTELVGALKAEHEESRIAAIEGLRHWVVQSPKNADLLRDEVARVFPDDEIELVVRLIWGYKPREARDEVVSRQLVDWLKHDDIAIRELAFYHVERLAQKKNGYRPLLPPPERKAAILRWEDHLKRFGALAGK